MGSARNPQRRWSAQGFLIEDFLGASAGEKPVYADKHLIVTRTVKPSGLRFAGEIDISNSDFVMESVGAELAAPGDPHLDVSRLSFCDVSGIRALVDVAQDLGDEKRLLLHGLPRQLETVMRVTGWSDHPGLVLCGCGGAL